MLTQRKVIFGDEVKRDKRDNFACHYVNLQNIDMIPIDKRHNQPDKRRMLSNYSF